MTELVDPLGQRLRFTWDAQFRLVAITDPLGQVTTIQYELPSDVLKVTKIVDPFNRTASFTYNDAEQFEAAHKLLRKGLH